MGKMATRKHGRNSRLYMGLGSAGTAEPVAFVQTWSINFATDNVDVTALGDTNKIYVAGLPDASGSLAGVWDADSVQLYTAAQDGVARKFYLYPDTGSSSSYWFGTMLPDFSVAGAVDGPITFSGDWQAASTVARVG